MRVTKEGILELIRMKKERAQLFVHRLNDLCCSVSSINNSSDLVIKTESFTSLLYVPKTRGIFGCGNSKDVI